VIRIVFGIFLALHGLVHLLYAAHSQRMLELQTDMRWPDSSWVLAPLLAADVTRGLAAAWCVLAALGFVAGGAASLLQQTWWRSTVLASAGLSTVMVLVFWDGRLRSLDDQGLIALLLNALIVILLVVVRWAALV
jgi:hypothetical protein